MNGKESALRLASERSDDAAPTLRHALEDLIDLRVLKDWLDAFYRLTGVGATLIDIEGNIVTMSTGHWVASEKAWQPICTDFHRADPVSAELCRRSDIINATACRRRANPFYTCFNGMIDSAIPIIVEDEHVATIFSGQYFFEPPDREYFRAQAHKFGYPEAEYLNALDNVPVLPRTHVENCLNFLSMVAQGIANMALTQKRLRIELERSRAATQAAQAAEKAQAHFFSAASHDLRQPLQGLRLFIDVLEEDTRGGPLEGKVRLASKALGGAEMIVCSLLDVARLEAGAGAPHVQAVDVSRLFGRMVDEVGPLAAAKGLELRTWGARGTLRSDPLMLERILRNLLMNAVNYTGRGGILLACRQRADKMAIEVWDTGVGIAAEHQDAIWDEFFQVGNPERDRDQGLGLGLPIVQKLAQRLGHRIELASKAGRGSRFRLVIDPAD